MLAKIIARGADREQALRAGPGAGRDRRARRARPTSTSCAACSPTPTSRRATRHRPDRASPPSLSPRTRPTPPSLAAAAYVWLTRWRDADAGDLWTAAGGWRVGDRAAVAVPRSASGQRTTDSHRSPATPEAANGILESGDNPSPRSAASSAADRANDRRPASASARSQPTADSSLGCTSTARRYPIRLAPEERAERDAGQAADAVIRSPMPGTVVAVHVEDGAECQPW